MTGVAEDINWRGVGPIVSMFVAVRGLNQPVLTMRNAHATPKSVATYALEDEDRRLVGVSIIEFDATLTSLPRNLAGYVAGCLEEAISSGAVVAWCAFEGSFHFDHVLTGDIASQIYAVADATGMDLAIDDDAIVSAAWRDRVARARASVTR